MAKNKAEENLVIRKVTLIGGLVDLLLGVLKLVVGFVGNSHALIADGIHSLSDLITDGLVILTARQSLAEPDEDHPYGHDRVQTLMAVVLAALLAIVGIGIAWDAAQRFWTDAEVAVPATIALWVAGFSALAKEVVFQYTAAAARRIDSKLLLANAWHSRTDALSSIVVFIAVAGAIFGLRWADAAGAFIVALLILHVAYEIARDGIDELIDTGVDADMLEEIRQIVLSVDGVVDMHDLRTRRMGSSFLADLHVHVNPSISVSEGHRIGDEVHLALSKKLTKLSDVVVHIDPEDDQESRKSSTLPLRQKFQETVDSCMIQHQLSPDLLDHLQIHYLAGKADLELYVTSADQKEKLKALRQQLLHQANIRGVKVFVSV